MPTHHPCKKLISVKSKIWFAVVKMNTLANLVIKSLFKEEILIHCQTCGETFYLGNSKTYASDMQSNPPPAWHINALRHAWNNPEHNVETSSPSSSLLDNALKSYANISAMVKRVKENNPAKANLMFDDLKHGFQGSDGKVKGVC